MGNCRLPGDFQCPHVGPITKVVVKFVRVRIVLHSDFSLTITVLTPYNRWPRSKALKGPSCCGLRPRSAVRDQESNASVAGLYCLQQWFTVDIRVLESQQFGDGGSDHGIVYSWKLDSCSNASTRQDAHGIHLRKFCQKPM